jgi:hypothetical protein
LVYFVFVLGLAGSVSAELLEGWQSLDIGITGGSTDVNVGTWTVSGVGDDVYGCLKPKNDSETKGHRIRVWISTTPETNQKKPKNGK